MYVTQTDLERALGLRKLIQLANDTPGAEAPDPEVLAPITAAASQIVDGYLRARYELPLAPVPSVIADLALRLACYALYARRMESAVPETVKDRREQAIKLLEHIQLGKVTLGHATTRKAVPEVGAMRIRAPRRQFGEDTLKAWRM